MNNYRSFFLVIVLAFFFSKVSYAQTYTGTEGGANGQYSALYFWILGQTPTNSNITALVFDKTNTKLAFKVSNSDRMTLTGGGQLGINNGSPTSTLHVNSSSTANDYNMISFNASSYGSYFRLGTGYYNSNNLEINTFRSSGLQNMVFQGDLYAGNVGIGYCPATTANNYNAVNSKLHLQGGNFQITNSGAPTPSTDLVNYPTKRGLTMGAVGNASAPNNSTDYSWMQSSNGPLLLNPLSPNTLAGAQSQNFVCIGIPKASIPATVPNGYNLLVQGKIMCEELKIKLIGGWYDHVFAQDYKLMSVDSLHSYITENHHLPDVPSAAEVEENGIMAGEMNAILLKKVEELTLYMIDQNKKSSNQETEIELLKKQNELLMQQVQLLVSKSQDSK